MKHLKQWLKVLFIPAVLAIVFTSCSQSLTTIQTKDTATTQITSQVTNTSSQSLTESSAPSDTNMNSDNTTGGDGQPPLVSVGSPPPGATPGNQSSGVVEGTGAYTQNGNDVTKSNETLTASNNDESAIKVSDSGLLNITGSTINTSGDSSSMDNSSFYGLNAAVLAESGSKITLANSTIKTTGTGANGAFATGSGSSVTLSNVKIDCTASGAHGVDATNAGMITLTDVDITTTGDGASAGIATDRGGGTISVTGGMVNTSGSKSPCIYSTGNITVEGGTMAATGSEAVVIEGKNSITLNGTTISGAKDRGVMIYQSFSGDASVGTGNFTMTGGSLTAAEGPLFYITNTDAVIALKNVSLTATSGTLLKASADSWGNSGSNGGIVSFTADSEELNGNIVCDNISSITLTLQNNTDLTGTVNADNTAKTISLNLDKTSAWNVTGTSYLTTLADEDATLANIKDNGHTIYYDATAAANSWLNGKTINLSDGGILTPA